jgi:predicted AAA+ superfamily ATPase
MPDRLFTRYIEPTIDEALSDTPVVSLLGARQVGKSTLARQLNPKRAYISFDDESNLVAAKMDPMGFVAGLPSPVTLDEVQRVPELLPALKQAVDEFRFSGEEIAGRYLLTGSANLLLLPAVQESLAGRMQIIRLEPLSELEKQRRHFSVLQALLASELKIQINSKRAPTEALANAVSTGGYPEPVRRNWRRAKQWYREYLFAIVNRDVSMVADVRDQEEMTRLVEFLAIRTATLLNTSSLSNEMRLARSTVDKYITILERLFLVRRLPAWHRNQAKRLVKTPKIHMVDSGLATVLNGLSPTDWTPQGNKFGRLLESFVVQQIICQAGWVDPGLEFYHYRDKDQVEVDLVLQQGRDVWGIEIKRSANLQDSDARGLRRLAAQAGSEFCGGIMFYTGANCIALRSPRNCFAVPISKLWGG